MWDDGCDDDGSRACLWPLQRASFILQALTALCWTRHDISSYSANFHLIALTFMPSQPPFFFYMPLMIAARDLFFTRFANCLTKLWWFPQASRCCVTMFQSHSLLILFTLVLVYVEEHTGGERDSCVKVIDQRTKLMITQGATFGARNSMWHISLAPVLSIPSTIAFVLASAMAAFGVQAFVRRRSSNKEGKRL